MDRRLFVPLYISTGLILACMLGALLAHAIGFTKGTEVFLSCFELALGSIIGSLATIVAGRGNGGMPQL